MKFLLSVVLLTVSTVASAHVGVGAHDLGFVAGLVHPFGLDHLLAMVAVGLFAARQSMTHREFAVAAPVLFVLLLCVGAAISYSTQLQWDTVELLIALSVIALAALLMFRQSVIALTLIAFAAITHGWAHGAEATGNLLVYMFGFAITTAILHALGFVIGKYALKTAPIAWSIASGAIALGGAYALVGVL